MNSTEHGAKHPWTREHGREISDREERASAGAEELRLADSSSRTSCFAVLGRLLGDRGSGTSAGLRLFAALAVVSLLAALVVVGSATAAKIKIASFGSPAGGELGHFSSANSPRGIAVNNSTGNVYVADFNNQRIDEFSSNGAPIRAWGNKVVASGQDLATPTSAVQTLTVTATGGKYTLKLSGQSTAEIEAGTGKAAAIQTALTALTTVGSGNATVSEISAGVYKITFAGILASTPEPLIETESGPGISLIGGTASIANTTTGATGFTVCNATSTPQDVCQAGTGSVAAGGLTGPTGVAIDQSNGNVYVTEQNNLRVTEYTEAGTWIATWGLNVVKFGQDDTGTGFEICKAASNPVDICQVGTAGVTGGAFFNAFQSGIAVNPTSHTVLVADQVNNRIQEFSSAGAFLRTFGADVVTDGAIGTGTLNGTTTISSVVTTSKAFQVGQTITSGSNIPSGTTITAVGSGTITLSKAATGSGTLQPLTVAPGAENIPNNEKQTVSLSGSPTGGTFTLKFETPNPSKTEATATAIPFNASAAELEAKLAGLANIGSGNVAVSGPSGGPWVVEFQGTRYADTDVTQMTPSGSGLTPAGSAVTVTSQNGLEVCTIAADCRAGAAGTAVGQFGNATGASRLAIDGSGNVYVVDFANQRVEKFTPSAGTFTPSLFGAAGASATPFAVAVASPSNNVLIGREASGSTSEMQVAEYSPSGTLLETHGIGSKISEGFASSSTSGNLAYYPANGNIYLSWMIPASCSPSPCPSPKVFILNQASAPIVHFAEVANLSATSATFKGTVTPPAEFEGQGYDVTWHFEYSTDGSHWTKAPSVDKSAGSTPLVSVPVEESVSGLRPNTSYFVRLCATTGTEVCDPNPAREFTTAKVAPTIVSIWPEEVTQGEFTLAAQINPNSLAATYHFEWGTEAGVYPHRVPAFERQLGDGGKVIYAQDTVSGLSPNVSYHYRVVAKNEAGTSTSEDKLLTTLNSHDLPDDRGIELVSAADKRPTGSVYSPIFPKPFFVASDGSSIAYPIVNSIEESTSGGEVYFQAFRADEGWVSSQLSPPSLRQLPHRSGPLAEQQTSRVKYVSANNDCVVFETFNPLTVDTPAADLEYGTYNLYRWSASDDSYTLITNRVPLNLDVMTGENYEVTGASTGCSRVFFRSTSYRFPGGYSGVYEWEEGTPIREALTRPDGTVPTGNLVNPVGVEGQAPQVGSEANGVSPDGRLFFAATSDEGSDSGKAAVFMREGPGPGEVTDVSQPAPGKGPTLGAQYETASPDGSRVFFLANYGLAATSSSGPSESCMRTVDVSGNAVTAISNAACDLYSYDVATETLTDISATSLPANTRGAVAQGVVAVDNDGSVVYFAARGQLIPGKGRTYAENLEGSGTINLYRYDFAAGGSLGYVGVLGSDDVTDGFGGGHDLIRDNEAQAQTNNSGSFLLYQSVQQFPHRAAYLYSAVAGQTSCISCPRDGSAPEGGALHETSTSSRFISRESSPRFLSEDGRAVFSSNDVLAAGAVPGQAPHGTGDIGETNIYEWHDGQISLLTSGKARLLGLGGPDGRDVVVLSYSQLDPRDFDFAADVYDFRSGGGFAAPPTPPAPCDPAADECQGAPSAPPAAPGSTSGAEGPGNPPLQAAKKHRQKKHRKSKRNHKDKRSHRPANTDRGGAK